MTPEAQRIAIAEACGWEKNCFIPSHFNQLIGKRHTDHGIEQSVPDYLNDLNAMHEAEKNVIFKDVRLYLKYAAKLEMVVGGNIDALFATATQRAEAFLRTLKFWKET